MSTFQAQNDKLQVTMKTHLIDDLGAFGIWEDDYGTFFESRITRISRALSKKIINQKSVEQLEAYEDIDESERTENL
jgi:hypothetical protein